MSRDHIWSCPFIPNQGDPVSVRVQIALTKFPKVSDYEWHEGPGARHAAIKWLELKGHDYFC